MNRGIVTGLLVIAGVLWVAFANDFGAIQPSSSWLPGGTAFELEQDPGTMWLGATPAIPHPVLALLNEADTASVFALDPGPETVAGGVHLDGDSFADDATGFGAAIQSSSVGTVRIQVAIAPGEKLAAVITCSPTSCARDGATIRHGRACAWTLHNVCLSVPLTSGTITVVLTGNGKSPGLNARDLTALFDWAMGHGNTPMPVPVTS